MWKKSQKKLGNKAAENFAVFRYLRRQEQIKKAFKKKIRTN
jgi:hypothetical protein